METWDFSDASRELVFNIPFEMVIALAVAIVLGVMVIYLKNR